MQIQCPSCSKVVEVPEGSAGQVVACPECGGQMQLPDSTEGAAPELQAAGGSAEPTKQCPYCGETVLAVARKCKHCKEDLAEGADVASLRRRLEAKEKKLAGGQPEIPASVGGKFRTITKVGAVIAVLALLAAVVILAAAGEEMIGPGVLAVTAAVIAGICTLVALAHDLSVPSSSARTTPQKGMEAFLKALCYKRYKYAYACLLDGDKDSQRRTRPKLEKFGKKGPDCSFATFEGFKDYWKGLLHTGSSQASAGRFKVVNTQGDFAVVSADIKLSRSSTTGFLLLGIIGALLMGDREKVSVSKLLRKVNGQWCVVNGELDSIEDGAMNVAAELAGK